MPLLHQAVDFASALENQQAIAATQVAIKDGRGRCVGVIDSAVGKFRERMPEALDLGRYLIELRPIRSYARHIPMMANCAPIAARQAR